jgi:TolB-like protein
MIVALLPVLTSLAVAASPPDKAAAAEPSAEKRIVVFTLKSSPELTPVAQRMTDQILLILGKRGGIKVLGEAEIQLLLEHQEDKKALTQCKEDDCLANASRAAEADKLITGHVGKWGEGFLVTLSVADAKKAVVERSESATGDSEKEAVQALGPALDRLLGIEGVAQAKSVDIAAKPTKIAVLDLAAYGAPQELADNLTQLLALELKRFEKLSVISRDEVKAMIQYETEKQIATCKSDVACLIEIGGALGVEYLVSGAIGKLEDTYVLNLKMMDIQKAEVTTRVSETYRGPERHLAQTVRFAVSQLVNRRVEGKGNVAIATDVDAKSKIDGGELVSLPTAVEGLPSGKHALTTLAEGYHPGFQEFYIETDQVTKVHPDLVELPAPWYKQWWAWTIIGSAVAAGVTASVIVARNQPDNGHVLVSVQSQR